MEIIVPPGTDKQDEEWRLRAVRCIERVANRHNRHAKTRQAMLAAAQCLSSGTTVTRWGVRMCNEDEVESGFATRAEAEGFIAMVRTHIELGEWLADDYEPMTVVSRERTTFPDVVTEWVERPGGDAE